MILPLAKLGTLALKTFSKPIAKRLKKETGRHPRFRKLVIDLAQANHRLTTNVQRRIHGRDTGVAIRPLSLYAGVAVILEVQRSSKSEARKEEIRRQELQEMRQREDDLSQAIELLKHRIEELEQMSKGRQSSSLFSFRNGHAVDRKARPT